MSDGYNGWTNYETWLVNVHISNDQGLSEMVQEWAEECVRDAVERDNGDARPEASRFLEDRIEEFLEEWRDETIPNIPSLYSDLLGAALQSVNYREIAEHYVEEVELWSAGWNMPGYMPDDVPALFLSIREAREYIVEYMERMDEDSGSIREGRGELSVTIGDYHYFVTKV